MKTIVILQWYLLGTIIIFMRNIVNFEIHMRKFDTFL